MSKKGTSIIGMVIAIVSAVIGFVIVDNVIKGQTWNSSLSTTIAGYVVPIGLLGVLALSAFLATR